jgi:opacity protein-like surface antigen
VTRAFRLTALVLLLLSPAAVTRADDDAPVAPVIGKNGLEYLVPELVDSPYRLDDGPRRFEHRISVSPAYGALGSEQMFAFRVAYNPNDWLGWEGQIGHNPGQSVHAVLHSLSAIVRRPLPGRFQPYAMGGYGMVLVFPGTSINADPVTKNALTIGGGMEFYIRNDLALRGDVQSATVIGRQRDREGTVAYDYVEYTFGFAFYRSIRP